MDIGSSPISITSSSRHAPVSPRYQTSNLTSALHSTTGNELRPTSATNVSSGNNKSLGIGRHDSVSGWMTGLTPTYGSGAQPISMNSGRSHPRRESVAGSLVAGMSWGGVSVGSWIRDDIIMQGTSPFAYQSPSFHSSSYLPKLEANFMKDFSCCGMTLPSLHDLLQHYEEAHAQQMPTSMPPQHYQQAVASNEARVVPNTSSGTNTQQKSQQQQLNIPSNVGQAEPSRASSHHLGVPRNIQQHPHFRAGEFNRTTLQSVQDMDTVEDMEMDDDVTNGGFGNNYDSNHQIQPQYNMQAAAQMPARSQFGRQAAARVPPLDLDTLNIGNPLQNYAGLRQSQPATPVSGGRPYHNNPTVSSVNTPTLTAHPLQQQQFRQTPDSSAPGTPAEMDPEFLGTMGNMSMDPNQQFIQGQQQDLSAYGFGNGNEMLDLCIDEPAKRLFSPNGGTNTQQYAQSRLGNAQYGANSEIARRIREQQLRVGLSDTVSGLNGEEPKPFRCPVIGCEKAYKNQNGLKYHKSHGHNNQRLHENADGTFSIVDPTTLSPYPGTLGMEKEKPYKCETCGKRYKNLNGLKYHKSHSPPCNPELKLPAGVPINAHGMHANVAGAGLSGIGEDMVH